MHDHPFAHLWVCRRCAGLYDPGRPDGQWCDCSPAACRRHLPRRWETGIEAELCRLCAGVAVSAATRWSVWFCGPCRDALGGQMAIGRHSVHTARAPVLLRPGAPAAPLADALVAGGAAEGALRAWRRTEARRLWDAAGLDPRAAVPVPRWEAAVELHRRRPADLVAAFPGPAEGGGATGG
ncbi:MAG: hypothetical protein MUE51_11740 [Thermoleophilia bacterium]|jgi:hypothetical protein|nr:hypothetical protein [Thermoleophilia bacterium]